jgi:hypothetical protein
VVKFVGKNDNTNNSDINHVIYPNEIGWIVDHYTRSAADNTAYLTYYSMFKIKNHFPYTVEVLGQHLVFPTDLPDDQDPCYMFDADGAPLILWEGSCETDWWSEAMWDDILPE